MYSKDRIEELVREAKLSITDEKYSYHLFGSIIDCTMFTMLLNKRMAKLFRKENKYWATGQKEEALPGRQDLQRAHEHGQRDRVPRVVRPQEHQGLLRQPYTSRRRSSDMVEQASNSLGLCCRRRRCCLGFARDIVGVYPAPLAINRYLLPQRCAVRDPLCAENNAATPDSSLVTTG
jgi:hypothetical protein